tara:strand:+ start:16355 stop:16537 length:183 start_codon:yes stop_codon:yes gene_type:complete
MNAPSDDELKHLQLQAMLRENTFSNKELMYLGEREGDHWYLIGGMHEVPVSEIIDVNEEQ